MRRHQKSNLSAKVARGSCAAGDFCSCRRAGSSYDRLRPQYIWSAADVQLSVKGYAASQEAACKPHSAYAVAYAAMTQLRDASRCGSGPMKPPTLLASIFNDALADLMSRYFVNIVQGTAGGADIDGEWADLKSDAIRGNFNALHYAMASTALYLTSHMGLALSALPHAEELWRDTGLTTIAERVEFLYSAYKPTYDAFNEFLAENVEVIGAALYDAGLIENRNINIAAMLVPDGRVEFFFERIRTKTFREAMKAAAEIPYGQHPLTQRYGGIYVMSTNPSIPGSLTSNAYGRAIKELGNHARYWRRLMGDGLGPVWKGLGGFDYKDLKEGGFRYNKCMSKLR